jgi:hypothetical protein
VSGDTARSLEPLQAASAAWDEMRRPYDAARARLDLGQALAAEGQMAQAAACLDHVLTNLERLAEELDDGPTRAAFMQSQFVMQARRSRAGLAPAG